MSAEITNEEIIIAVGKAQGYYAIRERFTLNDKTQRWWSIRDKDGTLMAGFCDSEAEAWDALTSEHTSNAPDWARDIAAAFPLAEEMQAAADENNKPFGPHIYVQITKLRVGGWSFGLFCEDATNRRLILESAAATLARAICLAFLQWKRGKS